MGKNWLIVLGLFLISISVHSQCTVYPVKEAVVNGNFESPTANPPTEFTLDGYWPQAIMANLTVPSLIAQSCYYSTKNAYWIASAADSFYCENAKKYGFGFCPGCFAITGDHTPGKAGKGRFLAIDTWADDAGPGTRISATGSQPIVWQQTVSVYPGQTYYFSAWAANWGPSPFADLRFFVQGNNDASPVQLGSSPFTVPSSTWTQFFQTWNSNLNTTATITIRNQTSSVLFGNDFALDDISFINSCQNVSTPPYNPNLGPDLSLCYNKGSITLNSNTPTNAPSRGFTWYMGTGTAQTVISPLSNTQTTLTVTATGTYRVCVFESGQCPVSSTININKNMAVELGPNLVLCNPAVATLATGYATPDNTISYLWRRNTVTVASGVNIPSYTVNSPGIYTLTITSTVPGCGPAIDAVTITSNLPVPIGTYSYCASTPQVLSVSGTGTYRWYASSVGGSSLGTGNTFTTPSLTGTGLYTFYVNDETSNPLSNTSWVGPGTQYGAGHNRIKFNTNAGIQIASVQAVSQGYQGACGAGGTGFTIQVRLLQNGATVPGYLATYTSTCGLTHTIPLNFIVPAGTNYELEYTPDNYFAWLPDWSPVSINYRPNGVVTVSNDQTNQHGGAFGNWVVNQVPGCARVPITITNSCPAPVEILSFTGENDDSGNRLVWNTQNEVNFSHFVVQRSTDGQVFGTLVEIQANGSKKGQTMYQYVDKNFTQKAYYRLLMVDYDGNVRYSNMIQVGIKEPFTFDFFPNPASQSIHLMAKGLGLGDFQVEVWDALGQKTQEHPFGGANTEFSYDLDISTLSPGVYTIKAIWNGEVLNRKLVKNQ